MKFSDHFIDQRVIIRAGGAPQTQPIVVAARNATPRDRSWLTFSGQVWHGGAVSTEHRVAEMTTFSTSRPLESPSVASTTGQKRALSHGR